jgi:hypothetical protein
MASNLQTNNFHEAFDLKEELGKWVYDALDRKELILNLP